MKGLLLDTEENQIRKVEVNELRDYYKAMHCDCITVVYTQLDGQQLAIICDDEALCKSGCLIPTVKLSSGDTIFNSVIFAAVEPGSEDFSDLSETLENSILQKVAHSDSGRVMVLLQQALCICKSRTLDMQTYISTSVFSINYYKGDDLYV